MECATNPYFVVQSIDRYFSQDNPWIAQIQPLRIALSLLLVEHIKSIMMCAGKHASLGLGIC